MAKYIYHEVYHLNHFEVYRFVASSTLPWLRYHNHLHLSLELLLDTVSCGEILTSPVQPTKCRNQGVGLLYKKCGSPLKVEFSDVQLAQVEKEENQVDCVCDFTVGEKHHLYKNILNLTLSPKNFHS